MTELQDLRCRAIHALQSLPGATALYAFGSLATGTADRYSDIDLEVVVNDLQTTVDARHAVFTQIGEVELEWRILPSRSGWAATLLFSDTSPYHRIDLGLSDVSASPSDLHEPAELLWRQAPPGRLLAPVVPVGFSPGSSAPEHAVIEQLLGATRYVKARKRGQHLTCFRFASALANAVMAFCLAGQTGNPADVRQKVSTSGYLALDESLPEAHRLAHLADLDFSAPRRMDRAVCALCRQCIDLLSRLPGAGAIPQALVDRLLAFIESELACRR